MNIRKFEPVEVAKCPCCGCDKNIWLAQCTDPNWYYVVCRNKVGNRPCSFHSSSQQSEGLALEEWNAEAKIIKNNT